MKHSFAGSISPVKRLLVVLTSMMLVSTLSIGSAQATADSTFDLTGVTITESTAGSLTPITSDLPLYAYYDADADVTTFELTVDNTLEADINLSIDSFSIVGVTGMRKYANPISISSGNTPTTFTLGEADTDFTTGLTNAAVTLTTHELVPVSFTSTISGMPSGVSIVTDRMDYIYYDESEDSTDMGFNITNSSNRNYTLKFNGSAVHSTDTVHSDSDYVFYIRKNETRAIYPFGERFPGDVRYNTTVALSGTLTSVAANVIDVKKLKLPKGFSVAVTADDLHYDSASRKTDIAIRILGPKNSKNLLRIKSLKLNGKKGKPAYIASGYFDEVTNKQSYFVYLETISGDWRSRKTITISGKAVKENETKLTTTGINVASIDQNIYLFFSPAQYWVYNAKKKQTTVNAMVYNSTGAPYVINLSKLVLKTKIKKKGKYKNVTIKSSIKSKTLAVNEFGPGLISAVFVIPGDLRTNGKPVTISGKVTH